MAALLPRAIYTEGLAQAWAHRRPQADSPLCVSRSFFPVHACLQWWFLLPSAHWAQVSGAVDVPQPGDDGEDLGSGPNSLQTLWCPGLLCLSTVAEQGLMVPEFHGSPVAWGPERYSSARHPSLFLSLFPIRHTSG